VIVGQLASHCRLEIRKVHTGHFEAGVTPDTARQGFHQCDETIRGHVFCSFLALVFRKELQNRLEASGSDFEWRHIKQDLKALQRVEMVENGHRFGIRTQSQDVCGKIFQAVAGIFVQVPVLRSFQCLDCRVGVYFTWGRR